jgi:molybdenum cofactor biosynthesis enzyme MoaA
MSRSGAPPAVAYSLARRRLGHLLRGYPRVRGVILNAEHRVESGRHTAAQLFPHLIQPRPYKLTIAVTARCNARCIGCRYGRDFMPGHQLSWEMTRDLLDDAAAAGYSAVRLYGGEPLLHPDLPRMVQHCRDRAMDPYVTTNAALLKDRIGDLFAAGLRDVTIGFYGVNAAYDGYTQRPGLFRKVEASIAAVRDRYGDTVKLQMNWLLMRPSCTLDALHDAYAFARKYGMAFQVDLVHYSLPYFTEGPDRMMQFRPEDRPAIEEVTRELLRLQAAEPRAFQHSPEGLRSIPDWLVLGAEMKVPCTAYQMIWVGADGTVQLCYVTFRLGNLHERRFRDMVFSETHRAAARDAFAVNCPNCHCGFNERVLRHAPTRRKYL